MPLLHAVAREQVEDAELAVAQSFVLARRERQLGRFERGGEGLTRAQVRGHPEPRAAEAQPFVVVGEDRPERGGLFLAVLREGNVGVAHLDVDDFGALRFGGARGSVGDALAVADEPEFCDSHAFRLSSPPGQTSG
jgi:hypothetical protein